MHKIRYKTVTELEALREQNRPGLTLRISLAVARWPEASDYLAWVSQGVSNNFLRKVCTCDRDDEGYIHTICVKCSLCDYSIYNTPNHDPGCECRSCMMVREVEDITRAAAELRLIDECLKVNVKDSTVRFSFATD